MDASDVDTMLLAKDYAFDSEDTPDDTGFTESGTGPVIPIETAYQNLLSV